MGSQPIILKRKHRFFDFLPNGINNNCSTEFIKKNMKIDFAF